MILLPPLLIILAVVTLRNLLISPSPENEFVDPTQSAIVGNGGQSGRELATRRQFAARMNFGLVWSECASGIANTFVSLEWIVCLYSEI